MRGAVTAMLMLGAITLAATTLRGCGGINTDCLLSDGGVAGSTSADPPPTPYNQVFRFVTHNSYWVNREHNWDWFASGVEERLLDQLFIEHARGVEIDIHPYVEAGVAKFSVYHTDEHRNTFCSTLADCLRTLRVFHYAMPQHEVMNVVIELKQFDGTAFPEGVTPADLDAQLALLGDANGSWLYRPGDLFKRCPGSPTLVDCVKTAGWPTTDTLRGRFIVTVIGNWEAICGCGKCIGQESADWITYSTYGDGGVSGRAAFPMVTNSQSFHGVDGVEQALQASVFWQVETLGDPAVPVFLAANGVVRGHDSFTAADQLARLTAGFQLLQTDYPWFEIDQAGPDRPFHTFDGRTFAEPGLRLLVHGSQQCDRYSFAATTVPTGGCTEWTTIPSTTRYSTSGAYPGWLRARGKGCLRAATAADAADADAVTVCREVVDRENVEITVETCAGGRCTTSKPVCSTEEGVGGVGDLLRLRVCTTGDASSVFAFSASLLDDASGDPEWVQIGDAVGSPSALVVQGVAATKDVLFVNTRRDGNPIRGADLAAPVVVHKPSEPELHDATLIDLSH